MLTYFSLWDWVNHTRETGITMLLIHHTPGNVQPTVSQASPMALDFLDQCLRVDIKLRPTATELLKHPWVNPVPNAEALSRGASLGPKDLHAGR